MYVFFNSVFFNLFFIFYITSRLHHTHYTPLWRGRQPRKPTKAPAANEGRRRPTKRENGPYVCFFLIMYFFKNLQLIHKSIRRPTATDDGQRRPTQARSSPRKANAGPRRPTATNNHRYVFFIMYFFKNLRLIHAGPQRRKESPRQPTAANEGQHRPTKREKGPNDARHVVWAGIGKFVFNVFLFNVQLIYKSPRRPTAANKGRCRPTKMKNDP